MADDEITGRKKESVPDSLKSRSADEVGITLGTNVAGYVLQNTGRLFAPS
ncbi:hypothetical protein GCM10010503_24990 [Streptomyces lucensis JCM 4490]|uniref:Uncharacterized protein n=1 Tax=Streptomyces lucensis JCM 4490 TaxID=1306176 RepID=A0A918J4Z6_9ACTN|nr:hypothetical protein [Streptomyces lucensis]GGW47177.1 hypothetical protein GCM10010503_24990 [Streptomyces lucensis JCM 4490]